MTDDGCPRTTLLTNNHSLPIASPFARLSLAAMFYGRSLKSPAMRKLIHLSTILATASAFAADALTFDQRYSTRRTCNAYSRLTKR